MSNKLYQSMMPQSGFFDALSALKKNPFQFISQKGLNIPSDISGDPNQIIQHLMNTGQISQDKYNAVVKNLQRFKN